MINLKIDAFLLFGLLGFWSSLSLSLSVSLSLQPRGRANRVYSIARNRVDKALQHAYVGRKLKKRNARRLWIQKMNAGLREYGVRYGQFIDMQNKGGVRLNRKILSHLAEYEPFSFRAVLGVVQYQANGRAAAAAAAGEGGGGEGGGGEGGGGP